MTEATNKQPNNTAVWLVAMRPRTLPLAIASIIMGSFLAAADGLFDGVIAFLCVITAVFLQILSNLANDYGDSVHGADSAQRSGPQRAVQSGQISSEAMRRAMAIFALLSILSGLSLVILALGTDALLWLIIFLVLGAVAILAAITYTAGSNPYGYVGLGDISVFIFFGLVGVLGTYFLQAQRFDWLLLLPATSCGLLIVGVLNVNNIRDIESDKLAGKQSIPVRIGRERACQYHWSLLIGAIVIALLYVAFTFSGLGQLLFLVTVPLLWRNGTAVATIKNSPQLNPYLKQLSLTTLLFVITFGVGQLLPF